MTRFKEQNLNILSVFAEKILFVRQKKQVRREAGK